MAHKVSNDSVSSHLKHSTGTLRFRLLASVGGVLVVTLLFGMVTALFFVYRTETKAWQGRQGDAVQNAAATITGFAQRTEDSLKWLSLLSRSDAEQNPQLARNLLYQNPALLEVMRTDAAGRILVATYQDRPVLAQPEASPRIFQIVQQVAPNNTYLDLFQLSSQDERFLVMAVRVPAGGAVVGRMRMDVLSDVVDEIRFGTTGRAFIVTRDGQIVAHTNHALVTSNLSIQDRSEMTALLQAKDNAWFREYTDVEGVPVVGTATPVPGSDWIVIAQVSRDEAYTATHTSFLWIMLGEIIFGALVLVVCRVLLEYYVLMPIERLRDGAKYFGRGLLDCRVPVIRNDEIGLVAQAFNEMAGRLQIAQSASNSQRAEIHLREN